MTVENTTQLICFCSGIFFFVRTLKKLIKKNKDCIFFAYILGY